MKRQYYVGWIIYSKSIRFVLGFTNALGAVKWANDNKIDISIKEIAQLCKRDCVQRKIHLVFSLLKRLYFLSEIERIKQNKSKPLPLP